MDIIRTKYRYLLYNTTVETHGMFDGIIQKMGGKDITLESLQARTQYIDQLTKEQHPTLLGKFPDFSKMNASMKQEHNIIFGDAQTNLFNDRIINNMAATTIQNTTLLNKLYDLLVEAGHAIERAAGKDLFEQIKPHIIKFKPGTNIFKMGLAQIFNSIRSLIILCEQTAGNLVDILLTIVPMYWHLAIGIMSQPISIPFLNKLWTKKINRFVSQI